MGFDAMGVGYLPTEDLKSPADADEFRVFPSTGEADFFRKSPF